MTNHFPTYYKLAPIVPKPQHLPGACAWRMQFNRISGRASLRRSVMSFRCIISNFFLVNNGLLLNNLTAETFLLDVIIVFILANEAMHTYSLYTDSLAQAGYIRRITELQQQVHRIFKSIPEAIFVINTDFTVMMMNTAANTIIAETSVNFLKQTALVSEDETKSSLETRIKEILMDQGLSDIELGKSMVGDRTFEWKVSLVSWEGKPAVTLLMRDAALIQLEQIRHEAHMKNVMLRSVSHELRTPANAFTNLIERALKCSGLPSEAKNFLSLAHDNCQHLLHVVNDLLDYSQFLHGTFRLSKRKFDIRKTLKSSFKPYEYMIKASGLTAELIIDPNLPMCAYNDPNRISQVIMNLLNNAAKFTKEGGIKVEAKKSSHNCMLVSVTDTGIGISEQYLASLRKFFGELKQNYRLNLQGEGLGLHISNLLALHIGGDELKLFSSQGRGTCFSFLVSLKEIAYQVTDYTDEIEEDKLPVILPLFSFGSRSSLGRVLVVDDNVFNRDIISSILEDMGIDCVSISSGREAIKTIVHDKEVFDLMFLDHEMPDLNGPVTARRIKELAEIGELPDLPAIVAYTAFSSEKDMQE
mmetsp:Transcript_32902/g.57513  ORF Transcript_32902/g.57513 Transcript_32902/m.57513 type:complete len:586 (-) Transcript_32902:1682-3439(-)